MKRFFMIIVLYTTIFPLKTIHRKIRSLDSLVVVITLLSFNTSKTQ